MAESGSNETFRSMAQDGADITTPSAMPSGGWGIRGWLSALYTWFKSDEGRAVYGKTSDSTYQVPRIDLVTHAIKTIEYEHAEIHAGDHYFIKTFIYETGGNGATNYFSFTTPDTAVRIHAKANIAPDVDTEINIYEDATVTGGTPITAINNDRDSDNTADLSALSAPTVTVAGNKIWSARTGGGKNPVGVEPGLTSEIIAKTDSTYVFEIIKRTTADLIVDIDFWWYEHTPKGV